MAVLVGEGFDGVFCGPLTVLRLVRGLDLEGWGRVASRRRGGDRVWAGQAAVAGGPQAASDLPEWNQDAGLLDWLTNL